MSMKDFHCEMLELSLRFSSEDLDQEAFLKAAGIEDRKEYTDPDGDFAIGMSFAAREQGTDYHAHIRVRFFKEGNQRIEISYHDSRAEAEAEAEAKDDAKAPYAEDCAQWIGGFFKVDRVPARISASYTFGKSFSPLVSLPFPVVSSEKALAGSLVTGLSILFPREKITESAIIQVAGDETILFFNTESDLNLTEFDLLDELEKLSPSINSLIKTQGNSGDNRKETK